MKEKSAAGGSRNAAIAAAIGLLAALAAGAPGRAPPAGAPVAGAAPGKPAGAKVAERPGLPPNRPPDKLSQPSTLSLKKSVRTIRLEVIPPCECPTNQKALMFSRPTWS